jgi:hypothetical protein
MPIRSAPCLSSTCDNTKTNSELRVSAAGGQGRLRHRGWRSSFCGFGAWAWPNTGCTFFYVGGFVKSWVGGAKGRATLKGTLG